MFCHPLPNQTYSLPYTCVKKQKQNKKQWWTDMGFSMTDTTIWIAE